MILGNKLASGDVLRGSNKIARAPSATRAIAQISEKMEDKAMYDSREKAIRDYQSAMNSAIRQARQEGLQEGALIGEIELLQELLGVDSPSREELSRYDQLQLKALAERFKFELRSRK